MGARRRLRSVADARRYLSHLINAVESGNVDPQMGGRLAYITNIVLRCMELDSLEGRLASLEEEMANKKQ